MNHIRENEAKDENTAIPENNYGFYLIGDQQLWKDETHNKGLNIFFQYGLSPGKLNINKNYFGTGFNFNGLFNKQGKDILGLAVAHANLEYLSGNETTLELTYQFPILNNIFIQPDLQYIINPAGLDEKLDNSLAAAIRFGFSF